MSFTCQQDGLFKSVLPSWTNPNISGCLNIPMYLVGAPHALRTFLGSQGMKKGDLSKFIEEAVRWRIFHQAVHEARKAFADVSPDELQKMIDEVVEDVRAKHYRERAKRS